MKQKVNMRDMVLGAVIMLVGLAVGAIVSPPLIAQRAGVFGEIQCTSLTVVDNDGKVAVVLEADKEVGNGVTVFDKHGKPAIDLVADEMNGVAIFDEHSKVAVALVADKEWAMG